MHNFDESYMARREEQIRKSHEMAALRRILFALALLFTFAALSSFVLKVAILGTILGIVAVSMWIGTAVLFAIVQANQAADEQIQREREQLIQMMASVGEKVKRTEVVLSDDGELVAPEEAESSQRLSKSK